MLETEIELPPTTVRDGQSRIFKAALLDTENPTAYVNDGNDRAKM